MLKTGGTVERSQMTTHVCCLPLGMTHTSSNLVVANRKKEGCYLTLVVEFTGSKNDCVQEWECKKVNTCSKQEDRVNVRVLRVVVLLA